MAEKLIKLCRYCSKTFITTNKNKVFCKRQCNNTAWAEKNNPIRKIALKDTSLIGTLSELKVAADLISRGFHVFTSASRTGPCDLIALKDDKLLKIEVKTQVMLNNGTIRRAPISKNNKFDILAYCDVNDITYIPSLEIS